MRSAPSVRRRVSTRSRLTVGVLLGAAGLLAGCAGPYASAAHHYSRGYSTVGGYPRAAAHPTPAEQAVTLHDTLGYRRLLLAATERLSVSVEAVSAAAASGRLGAARRDELAAQAAYDVLRPGIQPASATANQLDGESWNGPSGSPDGLHAIERALWQREDLRTAHRLAAAMAPETLDAGFLFYRANDDPAQVLALGQAELAWVVAVPVVAREEAYSHLDLVDVDASVDAARAGFALTAPLGRLVAPAETALVGARFRVLDGVLGSLGAPATRPDSSVPSAAWRTIAVDVDAVNGPLGVLAGDVSGFGTGRTYA